MKKIITVSYPLNMRDQDKFLYEPYLSYELSPVKIKNLRNVFIGNSGFCMNNKGLIKECHHNYPQQYTYYLNEAAQYYYNAQDQPENLLILDDDNVYLTIHHPWFNYYHWVCESLFRLWKMRRKLDELVLVLPEFYRDADFIIGSIEPFKVKNIFFIPNGKSLMVKNLCMPQIKPICDSYNAGQLKQVSQFYRKYVLQEKKVTAPKIEKLYVSRELASRRKVTNEDQVQSVIKKHGFTVFHPEKFSFQEQVAIFSGVKYLVGTHGSALTNLLFMQKKTAILELHKNKTNELNHPSPLFWYMADALGINYYHQLCATDGREDYFDGDYIIDAALLERNLIAMLSR